MFRNGIPSNLVYLFDLITGFPNPHFVPIPTISTGGEQGGGGGGGEVSNDGMGGGGGGGGTGGLPAQDCAFCDF